jgi:hypothetical protein
MPRAAIMITRSRRLSLKLVYHLTHRILFYQDRTASYAASNTYSGSGNVTGTFYFPTTSLSYSGSGNAAYQAIVANTITMTGSGNFSKDTGGTLTGLVQTVAALIQ